MKVRFLSTFNTWELSSSTAGEPALNGQGSRLEPMNERIHELVVNAHQTFAPLQCYS